MGLGMGLQTGGPGRGTGGFTEARGSPCEGGGSPDEGLFGEAETPAGKRALETVQKRERGLGRTAPKSLLRPVWVDSPEDGAAAPQINGNSAVPDREQQLALLWSACHLHRAYFYIY